MDQSQQQLPPELQEALQRRQGNPQGGQPQVAPQPQTSPQDAQTPPMPPQDPSQMTPATPDVPFDIQEVKMIEGALINRLKALTDAQFPKEPTTPSQVLGGQ